MPLAIDGLQICLSTASTSSIAQDLPIEMLMPSQESLGHRISSRSLSLWSMPYVKMLPPILLLLSHVHLMMLLFLICLSPPLLVGWLTGIRNRQMLLPSPVLLTVLWMMFPGLLVPIAVRSSSLLSKRNHGWEWRTTCCIEKGQLETEIPQQLSSSWSFRPSPARKSWSLLMTRLGIWDVSLP